jgi:2-oxoglutarate dehydrogenase E2 component (dihydrolipoamide succinyltransferase)
MSIEIKVPTLPESVADAVVAKWYKKAGEFVERDENLVDLETDKVMLEVPAPKSGIIESLNVSEGDTVEAQQVLAVLKEGEAPVDTKPPAETAEEAKPADGSKSTPDLSPAVRRMAAENDIDTSAIQGSGKGGRITKQDLTSTSASAPISDAMPTGSRTEKRVPMSRLRQRIAERLVDAQHQAAMLTTFNEINMKPVMDIRKRYKDQFEKKHGVRLGFMSFFTKAVVEALKRFPVVNASIDGTDLIYHNYFDIGVAIGSPRGLVVPILRNTEFMSMSDIEKQIREYAQRAQTGKVTMEEMTGGTFTVTNGGTFGSMLSTPIVNPPQSAILGMHNIVDRPVVENGEIVIRPIMYVALSYDHRVVDGRESVQFLVTIKEMLEDPSRLLLEV